MKSVDVKSNTYINSSNEINDKGLKFKSSDIVRISRYKNIFSKCYIPNWSQEVLVIIKVKNTVPRTYVISDLNGEVIIGTFYEKELQRTNEKEFRTEKIMKRNSYKLCIKWKGCESSFNSWIDKSDNINE